MNLSEGPIVNEVRRLPLHMIVTPGYGYSGSYDSDSFLDGLRDLDIFDLFVLFEPTEEG